MRKHETIFEDLATPAGLARRMGRALGRRGRRHFPHGRLEAREAWQEGHTQRSALSARRNPYRAKCEGQQNRVNAGDYNSPAAGRLCRAACWTEKPRCTGASRKAPASREWTENTQPPCRTVPGPGPRGGAPFRRAA